MTPKILSVDDSTTIRLMLAKLFRPFDCELLEASNGEEAGFRSMPVIMLTANSSPANIAVVARLGVRDYVAKPFREEEFLAKVGRIIPLVPRCQS